MGCGVRTKAKLSIGYTSFGHRIFAGKSKPLKGKEDQGLREFIGEKVDVTEDALNAVFEYLKQALEKGEGDSYGADEEGYIIWKPPSHRSAEIKESICNQD